MVAIPKPNKSLDNVWSYRSISLLCVPYKILERLIHSHVKPIIDPLLPPEQAGFRRGRTALEQATRISQDIEDCSEDKKESRCCVYRLHSSLRHRMASGPCLQASSTPAR